MTRVDAYERFGRTLTGILAAVLLIMLAPGVAASARPGGHALGRPEILLRPRRLALLSIAWFGVSLLLWRPIRVRPSDDKRLALLAIGLPACVAGLGLVAAGRLALGQSYRVSSAVGVRLPEGQRLVTSGPYAVIRHPMYAGLMLAGVGSLLLYRTWSTVFFVVQLPSLVARARLEDRALAESFGSEWSEYRRRVPGWLPSVRVITRGD